MGVSKSHLNILSSRASKKIGPPEVAPDCHDTKGANLNCPCWSFVASVNGCYPHSVASPRTKESSLFLASRIELALGFNDDQHDGLRLDIAHAFER